MPQCKTLKLGTIDYDVADVLTFPKGLPGFERETTFVPVEKLGLEPVVFLQSLLSPELCFVALPMEIVDRNYQLRIMNEDLSVISIPADHRPPATEDLACLAIVCLQDNSPATANLLGPLVLNRKTKVCVQAIRDDSKYSANHPLEPAALTAEKC